MTETIYNPTGIQMREIAAVASALTSTLETLEGQSEVDAGDGMLIEIKDPIAVYTDSPYSKELLGWLVQDDLGFRFTQRKPE